jgi:type IV secretory pathway TraG/TraD family ATPase VirD4
LGPLRLDILDFHGPCLPRITAEVHPLLTAEHLSRMAETRTVHFANRALANAPLAFGPRRHTPEEVRRLPDGEALVFVAGQAPIRGRARLILPMR